MRAVLSRSTQCAQGLSFGQRVMELIGAAADVAEAPAQPGAFRLLSFIYSDSHPVSERTRSGRGKAQETGNRRFGAASHDKC